MFVLSLLVVWAYWLCAIWYRHSYLARAERMYAQMKLVSNIPIGEARINLFANRIWDSNLRNFQSNDVSEEVSMLKSATARLAADFTDVITGLASEDYPLLYNQDRTYPITLSAIVDGIHYPNTLQLGLAEGIVSYINCAKRMTDPLLLSTVNAPNKYYIQQQVLFISANGDRILPKIATDATNAY